MIAVLIALLSCTVAGAIVTRALRLRIEKPLFLGLSMLLGIAIPPVVLFICAMAGIRWSSLVVVVGTLLIALTAAASAYRFSPPNLAAPRGQDRRSAIPWLIDIITFVSLAGYAWYATIGPTPETDFISIWGAKGRIFAEAGTIDWSFLERANEMAHPDYPILLPLMFSFLSLFSGSWNAAALGWLFPFLSGATLLIIRSELFRSTGSRLIAALGTTASIAAAVSPYIGLAEGPLIAYGSAGVLMIRRGLSENDSRTLLTGAILLGLAGSMKNEGLTLIVAVVISAVLVLRGTSIRRALMLWPAIVIPIPWIILRRIHHLETDLTRGSMFERIWSHVHDPARMVDLMTRYPLGKPLFWIGIAIGLVLTIRYALRSERFLLITLAVQYAFVIGAYFATPHDLEWHFRWSWERVVNQQTLLLEFMIILGLSPILSRWFHRRRENEQVDQADTQRQGVVAGSDSSPSIIST